MHFGVNHLGHFLLTNLLLSLLEKSSPSRIVVVASSLAKRARIDFDNIHGEKSFDKATAPTKHDRMRGPYSQSKLANMLFAHELNKRLPDGKVSLQYLLRPGYTPKTLVWRQHGRVVSALDSQSGGPGFESCFDHWLDLFRSGPEFKSSTTLVNRQLTGLPLASWDS